MFRKLTPRPAFLMHLALLACLAAPIAAQEGDLREVTVQGISSTKERGRARDDAIENGMRRAVEQAAGVFVDAASVSENFELIADKILTKAAGYVRTYKILSEKEENGIYFVEMTCWVGLVELKEDLIALELLKSRLGYPRVMVIGDEFSDGTRLEGRSVATAIENFLRTKGFDLVAKDFVEAGKERDAALSQKVYDDYAQAAALGGRFGAEMVVAYGAQADYEGPDTSYGVHWERYRSSVTIRLVKVDTAAVMASLGDKSLGTSGGREGAARKALENIGEAIAPAVFEKIVETWSGDIEGGTTLELVVTGLDFKSANTLYYKLTELTGIKSVGQPELTGNVAMYRLKGSLQGFGLAQHVSEAFGLEIDEVTGNRVKAHQSAGK